MIPSHEERVGRYIQGRERGVIDEVLFELDARKKEKKSNKGIGSRDFISEGRGHTSQ